VDAPPARLFRALRRRLASERASGLEVPEQGGREVQATVTRPPEPLGPNSGPCPLCGKPVALPLLEGHLKLHAMRGETG
jgi:hypothetical protein